MKYLLIVFIFLSAFSSCTTNDSNYLSIQNLSKGVLTEVKIVYSNNHSFNIGRLKPLSEYKLKLLESNNESAVSIIYRDEKSITHKILVIPYLVMAENKNYEYKIK